MSSLLEQLRQSLAPQYKVERELASGGMGAVFLARDVTLDRRVAIKIVKPEAASPDAARRFLREARTLASLSHPNVVPVYTAGETGGRLYYVMDYVEGETLEARLARGTLSAEEALKLAIDLLGALEAAHERGIVHRDVKPGNVFLVKNRALLGDFGIAKHTEDTSEGFTAPGHRVGTPGYMAPEQVTGDATPRTDLYAVGMVLYEALSGRKWSVLTKTGEADWSGVPGGLAVVLERALAWSPEDRWEDAAEFRKAILAASGRDESVAESPTGLAAFLSRLRKRRLPGATTRIQPGRPVGARRAESPAAGAVPGMIEVTTLGGAAVRRDGIELSALSKHKQKFALLVYLAVEGPVARDQLLAVFWPDKEEEKARHSLSQALYSLKRELNQECVRVSGDQISLSTDTIAVDVKRMEEAAANESWGSVVELYRGPFLDQFSLPGSVEFEDWQSRTRTRLARLARRAFAEVIERRVATGDPQAALAVATRWAALQPLEDEAQHTFIALLARAGRRSDALKHYQAYRDRLARELEVEPLEETAALVERIKRGEMPEFLPLAAPERRKEVPAVRELPTGHYFKTPSGKPLAKAEPAAAGAKSRPTSVLEELRKRRVFYVGAAYLVVSWLVVEISATFIDRGMLPEWVFPVLLFFLVVGLPFALILAWAQEQQVVGTPSAKPLPTTGPWPRWFEKVRGGHVLAFLSALVLALLVVVALLERGALRFERAIDAASVSLPEQKHLAVIPFTNVMADESSQAFCDGLAETVTSKLTQLQQFQGSLWVVPAIEVRERGVSSPSEAQKVFGINLALTGSVLILRDSVRVTLNLVNAESMRQLRSSLVEEARTNVPALHDKVVLELVNMLELPLERRAREVLAAGGTTVPGAYDFYLQGRGYLARYEVEANLDHAIGLFERALALDPTYALAYAGLGEAYRRKHDLARDAALVVVAQTNSARALELDERLGPVHVTLGLIHHSTGQYEEAVQEFERALELDPADGDAYRGLASAYEGLGRLEEAESTYKKAIDLRPSYWAGYNELGNFYYGQHHFEEAEEPFRRVIALTPDNPRGYNNLGGLYTAMGRLDEAEEMLEASAVLEPSWDAYSNLATLYYWLERYADAARIYEQALKIDERDHRIWYNLGVAYELVPEASEKAHSAFERTAELLEEELEVNSRDPSLLIILADTYAHLDQKRLARGYLQQALGSDPTRVETVFRAAEVYEMLGDRELALKWIGEALRSGLSPEELEHSAALEALRSDPRFQEVLQ